LRSKEVGIRKVFGADRTKLICQFLSESILISFVSLILALAIVQMLVNPFNTILNTELNLNYSILFVIGLFVFGSIIGVVSGIYPSFILSSYKIVDVLKGTLKSRTGNYFFRRVLIIFQFILTSIVIIGTIVVGQQLNFILSKDLGYVKDDIISIEITPGLWKNYKAIKSELLQHPGVINVTLTNSILERKKSSTAGHNVSWTGKENHMEINSLTQLGVDYDYLDVHQMKMVEGRYFSQDFGTDGNEACVINESAVKEMGLTSPIGTEITFGDHKRKVVGVVNDFHFTSLHQQIEPLIMVIGWGLQYVCIKIEDENQQATIDFIENKLKTINPDEPFQYEFVESRIDQLYLPEKRTGFILKYGTFLSIILSSLGLFGLISFITKRRMKEICIRKILGSSVLNVVVRIMKEVLLNALFALIIAIPLAIYFAIDWLNSFAYKVDLSWWIFALTVIIIFALSLLTTGFQTFKAASSNPVKYLNYE
jgi:putative ABC transport system permease protein